MLFRKMKIRRIRLQFDEDTLEAWYQHESSELPVEITICLDSSYNLGYLVLKRLSAIARGRKIWYLLRREIWNKYLQEQ